MLHNNEIIHSDINAIITGPNRGNFTHYTLNPAYPNRNQPFREFTLIFHDEMPAIQAFPVFEDPVLGFTLAGVRDQFAINYGSGGAGAMILANRLGVGPGRECAECAYEDIFLTSWVNGDPAMIVDNPANTGISATKAFYPDDPSNVYHGYLSDHTKFRILHAGTEHHLFHLHTHQWLFNPDDDNSTYLDSQAIGPNSAYTLEIAYNGGGNRNKSAGDSIFHCHFYPHFAQGMWSLWRVHDVFEIGTVLDPNGRPVAGSRALPDGEIIAGTPIPAIVPIPGLPMAPMPGPVQLAQGDLNKDNLSDSSQIDLNGNNIPDYDEFFNLNINTPFVGYPFYIPAIAGHHPPHPPLSHLFKNGIHHDGGLPRHVIAKGSPVFPPLNRLDFSKDFHNATAIRLPEEGTAVEALAMGYHATRFHNTFRPDGTSAQFETNGLPPKPGAAFADPCRKDDGTPVNIGGDINRRFKTAVIRLDMKINKAGWHFPQSHIMALWDDVAPLLAGTKAPEPYIIRAKSGECIENWHTNLVPRNYEQDDFQVKTPIDMIGQHIHLVKFDVLGSSGGGVGFNYEDSTMSYEAVQHHIHAINETGGIINPDSSQTLLQAMPHPFFGTAFTGATTTVYRWWADPLLNNQGIDRTLGNVFTHDHMTPSTTQQTGLYGMLIIEPSDSTWRDPETGAILGGRLDGGPTSWRADIITGLNGADSFREFALMFGDFFLAYDKFGKPINPPGKVQIGLPFLLAPPQVCPGGLPAPCPEAISLDDPGTFTVNYRNEPIALRVRDPLTNTQAVGLAGDLSFAFQSRTDRADPDFNVQPAFYPPLTRDVGPGDPFTPLLRVYEGDKVRLRVIAGAHEEGHVVTVHGVKWLQEFASQNSGFRNSQMMGISEQFIFEVPIVPNNTQRVRTDLLWTVNAASDGYWNGTWGLMRTYQRLRADLRALPNNPVTNQGLRIANANNFNEMCPTNAPVRRFDVTAVRVADALPGGTLIYNPRNANGGPLYDPTAIMYVNTTDLDASGRLRAGVPIEPLILRANAGDCIQLTLRNRLPADLGDPNDPNTWGFSALPMLVQNFNSNQLRPSSHVGLHTQLLAYDVQRRDGTNVGTNPVQTVPPVTFNPLTGAPIISSTTYRWYAGDVKYNRTNQRLEATPMEFGAINLMPSDRIKQIQKGAIAALIVEPPGATVTLDPGTRASATVTYQASGGQPGGTFREFVMLFQDDINLRFGSNFGGFNAGDPVPNLTLDDVAPEDTGQKAVNYRTEPMWFRFGFAPNTPFEITRNNDFSNAVSNNLIGGDPVTPVFRANAGTPVRFRLLQPGGHARNNVFVLHGHTWQRQPYVNNSARLGDNPKSFFMSAQEGHGPSNHFDIIPQNGAGGAFNVKGDYLWRTGTPFVFDGGIWGIFRVQ